MEILQKVKVACTPVMNIEDQYTDLHYQERKTYVEIQHPLVGIETIYANPLRLSGTSFDIRLPAPGLGEHNEYVLKELLGLSRDEIAELIEQKIIY